MFIMYWLNVCPKRVTQRACECRGKRWGNFTVCAEWSRCQNMAVLTCFCNCVGHCVNVGTNACTWNWVDACKYGCVDYCGIGLPCVSLVRELRSLHRWSAQPWYISTRMKLCVNGPSIKDIHTFLAFYAPRRPHVYLHLCLLPPASVDVHFLWSHFNTVPLFSDTSIYSQYTTSTR